MTKVPADLSKLLPITRAKATEIAGAASRFACTLTLECNGVVLNLKSMIGLLSQSIPKEGQMYLVADGDDEKDAIEFISQLISKI